MRFEANRGQSSDQVDYVARGSGYNIFLTETDVTLSLKGATGAGSSNKDSDRAVSLRMRWLGGAPSTAIGEEPLEGKSNYLRGSDPERWTSGVATYARVRYQEVYEGIDLVVYGREGSLEYDFVVAPGSDVASARVRFEGARSSRMKDGSLVLDTELGEVRQVEARAYQDTPAGRRMVSVRQVLESDGTVRFNVGEYDRTRPLVVDPVIVYAGFIGGGRAMDEGRAIAVDAAGATYIAGFTEAFDFPVTPGAFDTTMSSPDIFVTKIAPSGTSIVYATFLGGFRYDIPYDIAVDGTGAAYVAGGTYSPDFPATPGAYDSTFSGDSENADGFVTKLSPNGNVLVYSSFLPTLGDITKGGIAVSGDGTAVVTSRTTTPTFPTTSEAFDTTRDGYSDVFVMKLNASGSDVIYSTLLGGADSDWAGSVSIEASGSAVVVGQTTSSDFPVSPGAPDTTLDWYDGFVTRISATGTAAPFSTYVGGTAADSADGVDVSASGAIIVAGTSSSTDLPTTPGAFDSSSNGSFDVFVTSYDQAGNVVYLTYVGGAGDEKPSAVAARPDGAAVVVGDTASSDFPAIAAIDGTLGGQTDAFVFELSAAGNALAYSTFVGGAATDVGYAVAIDAAGAAYITGSTTSTDFPSVNALQQRPSDGADAFVGKLPPGGGSFAYASMLGGTGARDPQFEDALQDVAVDATGAAYFVGHSQAPNYPVTPGAYDTTYEGDNDVVVTKLNPAGDAVLFSTYLSGDRQDYGYGITVDSAGAVYVTGYTESEDFPTTPGAYDTELDSSSFDVFVTKLDGVTGAGSFSTFLGGFQSDYGQAVRVAANGTVYVAGYTSSQLFPVTPGAYDTTFNEKFNDLDAFVARFSADGSSLLFSTYLGAPGRDEIFSLDLDSAGSVVVAGTTAAPAFPTTPGAFDESHNGQTDSFVARLSAGGDALLYSTFLGGAADDRLSDIAVSATGDVYATGWTRSPGFPTTPGAFDTTYSGDPMTSNAFVLKLDGSGAGLAYSTLLCGDYDDSGYGIAIDSAGAAYVTGVASTGFPTTPGGEAGPHGVDDAFVTKLNPSGSGLLYSGLFGGTSSDAANGIAVGADESVYVVGRTTSMDFLTSGFGFLDGTNGFILKLKPAVDAIGLYLPGTGTWFLRSSNSAGVADLAFAYGASGAGYVPLAGDWDGDGDDTPGLYAPASGAFFLRNASAPGPADLLFIYGAGGQGQVPLAGDWDGDGVDTIGVYVPASGFFFLRNSNSPGAADAVFGFGPGGAGLSALVGDWNGDGIDSVGLYVTASGAFFLQNGNTPGPADIVFTFGAGGGGFTPIAGDWDGDGDDSVGLYGSSGVLFLRNVNAPGPADLVFTFGAGGAVPVTGNW